MDSEKTISRRVSTLIIWLVAIFLLITTLIIIIIPLSRVGFTRGETVAPSPFNATPTEPSIALYIPNLADNPFAAQLDHFKPLYIRVIDPVGKEAVLSYHYGARNREELLLSISIDSLEVEKISLQNSGESVLKRTYSGVKLYSTGEVVSAQLKNRVLFSTSTLLLESAIRSFKENSSIADTPLFLDLLSMSEKGVATLFINHNRVDKFLSKYIKEAGKGSLSLLRSLSNWSLVSFYPQEEELNLSTRFLPNYLSENSLLRFEKFSGGELKAPKTLPATTQFLLSISASEELPEGVLKRDNKANSPIGREGKKWLSQLKIKELATAAFPVNNELLHFILIRSDEGGGIEGKELKVPSKYLYPTLIEHLYGGDFKIDNEEAVVKRGDWYWIGELKALEQLDSLVTTEQTLHSLYKKRGVLFAKSGRGKGRFISVHMSHSYLQHYFSQKIDSTLYKFFAPQIIELSTPFLSGELFREKDGVLEGVISIFQHAQEKEKDE